MPAHKTKRPEGTGSVDASPDVVVRNSYLAASRVLPRTWGKHSRDDFSPAQFHALLCLRALLCCGYRALERHIRSYFLSIRDWIGITHVPHHTTLKRASRRLRKWHTELHASLLGIAVEKKSLAIA